MNKYETNYITKTCRKNNNRDTWIIKENTHKSIIEKEKYDKVQEIKLNRKGMTKVKHEYLLRDLLYCGQCKRKLQYKVYRAKDLQTFLYDSAGFNCSLFYKKRCKNRIHIREKDLNSMIKNEVAKKLKLIEINKLIEYCKEKNEDIKIIKEYKKTLEKLERKKSVLYKKKCEQYITAQEFKEEYIRVKEEIEKIVSLMEKHENNNRNKLEEKRIKEIITEFKKGNCINNYFLKEIINRIDVYSKNKIEIIFNL